MKEYFITSLFTLPIIITFPAIVHFLHKRWKGYTMPYVVGFLAGALAQLIGRIVLMELRR